jgi:hypothetical protein
MSLRARGVNRSTSVAEKSKGPTLLDRQTEFRNGAIDPVFRNFHLRQVVSPTESRRRFPLFLLGIKAPKLYRRKGDIGVLYKWIRALKSQMVINRRARMAGLCRIAVFRQRFWRELVRFWIEEGQTLMWVATMDGWK